MPDGVDSQQVERLRHSAVQAAWIHWAGLGAFINADRVPRSMVDPEALLILSLMLREQELRLWDIVVSFARNGSRLLSVQRVKNLLRRFPDSAKGRISEFADLAVKEGNDFRWRSLRDSRAPLEAREQEIWRGYPSDWSPSALVPRLRLAFGVGIAADLLGYLTALQGEWADAKQIALAIGYLVRPVRRAADHLVAAKLIEGTGMKPVEYRLDHEKWSGVLGLDLEPPKWRYWNLVFPFIAEAVVANESATRDGASTYLVSSRLRDLMERHQDAFRMNKINLPRPRAAEGEGFLRLYADALGMLSDWVIEVA